MCVAVAARPRGLGAVILATSLGFALVQLDVSILNVALARIGASLQAGVTGLQWVVDAYTVAFAALLLSAGALGDRIGARRAYIVGFIVFAAASLGCALAPNAATLIASRALQGCGAALLVPCSLALLTHACGDDAAVRAHAISLWTAAASVALAAGPVLGGMLVESLGWRSIFAINLPLGLAGAWLTRQFVAETRPAAGGFDLVGQALAFATLLVLTGAVIEAGSRGLGAWPVLGGLAGALLLGAGFVAVEARGRAPMLPLGFFGDRTFSSATLVGLAIDLAVYGTVFVLGLYFQQIERYSPLASGFALLPFAVCVGVGNIAAGRLGARLGQRLPMAAGLLAAAGGFLLLRRLDVATPCVALLSGLVLMPLGIGLAVPLMTSSLLSVVPRSRAGVASGVLNTVRQGGGGIGVALYGALLAGQGVAGLQLAAALSAGLMAAAAALALAGIERDRRAPVLAATGRRP